jgi:hypothetical protein
MTKRKFLTAFFCLLWFFLVFPPCTGSAQTSFAGPEDGDAAPLTEAAVTPAAGPEDGDAVPLPEVAVTPAAGPEDGDAAPLTEVAVMPFFGDNALLNALLSDAALTEIQGLGKYNPQSVSGEEHPGILDLLPDEPPSPEYLDASQYVLTGEFYIDIATMLEHVQLWLWNSGNGSLVYTDELVAEDSDEALSYIPPLISWIFSQIPEEEADEQDFLTDGAIDSTDTPGVLSAAKEYPRENWLYAGLRGGGSFRFYTLPELTGNRYSDAPYDFTYEVSFQFA